MTPQEFSIHVRNLLDARDAASRELERNLSSLFDEARASNISCDTCAHSCITHIVDCTEHCDKNICTYRPCLFYTPETTFTAQIRLLCPHQRLVDEIMAAWDEHCPIAELPECLQAPFAEIIKLVQKYALIKSPNQKGLI